MPEKDLPETYRGYKTAELLKVWEEIRQPEGTRAPEAMIAAMRALLREYRLGMFSVVKGSGK